MGDLVCKFCNKKLSDLGMPSHLSRKHHITVKDYYDKFYKKQGEGCCKICGSPTTFNTLLSGYRTYCSRPCVCQDPEYLVKINQYKLIKNRFSSKKYSDLFTLDRPHVYEYKIKVNGRFYYYIGSTIHSQYSRLQTNPYTDIIQKEIDKLGKIAFLENCCTILLWEDDKQKLRKIEAEINKRYKKEKGEKFVLSKVDGNLPSQNCLQAAVKHQKEFGSWNRGKNLSTEHRKAISEGGKRSQSKRYMREMKQCIEDYLQNGSYKYRISRYIRQHFNQDFQLSKESVMKYYAIICKRLQ